MRASVDPDSLLREKLRNVVAMSAIENTGQDRLNTLAMNAPIRGARMALARPNARVQVHEQALAGRGRALQPQVATTGHDRGDIGEPRAIEVDGRRVIE